jgi:hypothetical protein
MTREEFIKILEEEGYSYEIENEDKIIITYPGGVWLDSLETLPPGVVFKNGRDVWLESLETLPPGVVFKNVRDVNLESLKTLPPGVEFRNGGDVYLNSLMKILTGVSFDSWECNIEGVDPKRLLNLMISKGVFA